MIKPLLDWNAVWTASVNGRTYRITVFTTRRGLRKGQEHYMVTVEGASVGFYYKKHFYPKHSLESKNTLDEAKAQAMEYELTKVREAAAAVINSL